MADLHSAFDAYVCLLEKMALGSGEACVPFSCIMKQIKWRRPENTRRQVLVYRGYYTVARRYEFYVRVFNGADRNRLIQDHSDHVA